MSDRPPSQIPREEWDGLAAELVVGSLPPAERAAALGLLQRETAFALLVADWQTRLAPLADAVPEVAPAPALLPRIEQAIERAESAPSASAAPAPARAAPAPLRSLRRRLLLWKSAAIGLGAATAVLALMVWRPGLFFAPPAERFVAVLGEGEQQPRFLVTVDLAAERVSVLAIGDLAAHQGDFELWLVNEAAPAPRSLGLLPTDGRERLALRGLTDSGLLQDGILAVSLEPLGGSPTGLPTGPVVYSGPLLVQSE